MVYAQAGTNDSSAPLATVHSVTGDDNSTVCFGYGFGGRHRGSIEGFFAGPLGGCGRGGSVTVGQEYKDNVINITESDTDVQKLLAEGYNVTGVRPIISTTIEADGTVTVKATKALVTLAQNTTGRAFVWVNVEQAKVTRIEIRTMTVIEKP